MTSSYAVTGDFISKFGSEGFGDGQFDPPRGVTVDSNDNIIVADTGNHRIQIFDSDGNFISKFGSVGPTDGKFLFPWGVAVNSNDNIIVADTNNGRIQIFDSDGSFISTFGAFGYGDGWFGAPLDVTVDSNDNIIVADGGNDHHQIQIFDSDGNFISRFGSFGTGDGQFHTPIGVTVDSNDNIIVCDMNNNRIQIFDSDGNFITKFGFFGTDDGQFDAPRDVTVNSNGNIIVSDARNDRIQIFEGTSLTDTEPPVITLVGVTPIVLEVGIDTYTEQGATVTDNDPAYSESVTVGGDTVDANTIGTYIVTYDAPDDAAGNTPVQITRTVNVEDATSPAITLNGDNPTELIEGETYTEQGATVTDNSGEDLSSDLIIDASAVDTNTAGTYQVTYDVSDSSGNDATTEIRTVNVITPSDAAGSIIDDIEDLVDDGTLNNGQGNSLIKKIQGAIDKIDQGNTNAACGKLNAFVNQVSDLIDDGVLTSAQGQPLIDAAQAIMNSISC